MGAHAALNGSGGVEDNVVIGYQAMMNYTGGDRNTVVGTYAGRDHENGSDNAFYGYRSGQLTSSGNNNTFLGNHAGRWNQTGSSNTYVGYFAGQPATGGHNFINSAAIGANAIVRNSNQMILGNNSVLVGIGLSDNATGSRDKLEINASVSGVSGLQFTTLNYGFVPSSIATKFLTVDGNGKVILRDIPSGSGNVIACATPGPIGMIPRWTGITGPNFELCNSIIYDNLANVGISNTTPNQKLDVNGNVNLTRFDQSYYIGNKRFLGSGGSGFSSSIELGFDAGPASGANSGYDNIFIGYRTGASLISGEQFNILIGGFAGVSLRGVGSFPEASQNVLMGYKSGEAVIEGSENTFIGHRSGSSTGLSKSGWNSFFGSFAGARNEDEGDYNTLLGYNTNLDISRSDVINYSTALGADAWVGSSRTVVIGSSESTTTLIGYNILPSPSIPNTCRLYVNSLGDAAFFNGDCYSSGTFIPSDSSLKLNIVAVQRNLSSNVLDGLNPKTYTFDSRNNPSLNLPSGQQIGLMADEVERVMPNLVHEFTSPAQYDSSGMIIANEKTFKAVNYTGLIPVLIDEAKNSKEKIDSITDVISNLQDRVDRLERTVAACCSNASGLRKVIPNQDVELANSIILNQNSPNPFAEQTVIEYSISDSFNAAKIIFYNQSGVILKTVKIESSGKGQITVYAENLSAGIYSYSLLVDGKVIDTKRMVCAK